MLAQPAKRQAKQDGQQEHLQNIPIDECADKRPRDDVQQELHRAHLLGCARVALDRFRIERRRIGVESGARRENVRDDQPDYEREPAHELKIKRGAQTDAAEPFQIAHPRQPNHHGREDDRPNQHFHQAHERVAQRLQLDSPLRFEVANQPANHDPDQDLKVERVVFARGAVRQSRSWIGVHRAGT